MTDLAFKITSKAARALLFTAGVVTILASVFAVKWGFAHSVARGSDAVEVVAFAVELGPADPQTHYSLAVLSEKSFVPGELQMAILEYERAVSLSPNNYLLWLGLGKARERIGDRDGAERALGAALELAPNYSAVQWALGNVLLRQGKTEEGFTQIRKAAAGDNSYTNAAAAAAWQQLDGNMEQVRQAIGDSTRLNAAFAVLLAGEKRFDEAFGMWNEFPDDQKRTTLKETGSQLSRQFAEAGQYRHARRIGQQIGLYENSIETLTNGDFESPVKMQDAGIFEWRIGKGASPRIGPTEGQKRSGNYSLLMSFGSGSKEFRQISQIAAVEPGKTYKLELSYRSDLKTSAALKWEVVAAASGEVLAATNALANSPEWNAASAEFAVPANVDGVIIRMAREGCSECSISGSIWFDDFRLTNQ